MGKPQLLRPPKEKAKPLSPEAAAMGERIKHARRLKACRDDMDIGPKTVADALGLTVASVSRWESGTNPIKESNLVALAAYLGVTAAWLRYGDVAPMEPPELTRIEATPLEDDPPRQAAASQRTAHRRRV